MKPFKNQEAERERLIAEARLTNEINCSSPLVRQFVHDLETRVDPEGEVRDRLILRCTAEALAALLAERRGPPR